MSKGPTGKADVEQINATFEEARATLLRMQSERDAEQHDAERGFEGAAARAELMVVKVAEQERIVSNYQAEHALLRREADRLERLRINEANDARLRSIPRLRAEAASAAADVERHARELASAIDRLAVTCTAFAAASNEPDARRALGYGAIQEKLRCCLYNFFNRKPSAAELELETKLRRGVTPINWLGWPINAGSPLMKIGLSAAVSATFDTLDCLYETQEDAIEARARIFAGGANDAEIAKSGPGLWTVLKRSSARGAARLPVKGTGQ